MIVNSTTASSSIAVSAYGTPYAGTYPHVQVFANGVRRADFYVTGTASEYTISGLTLTSMAGSDDGALVAVPAPTYNDVDVRFTNDAYDQYGDRNLFVKSITVGGGTY